MAGVIRRAFVLAVLVVACALAGGERASAAVFWVNSSADTAVNDCADVGPSTPAGAGTTCTLRGAIAAVAANSSPAGNNIDFSACGPFTVSSALPPIPGPTIVNGFSNAEAEVTNQCAGGVELIGQGTGPGGSAPFPGLVLDGSGSTLFGFFVHGFADGVRLGGTGGHRLYFNGLGTGPSEYAVPDPPNAGDGIEVLAGSAGNVIGRAPDGSLDQFAGGLDADYLPQNDVFANRGWGVHLDAGSGPTVVAHDFIGTGGFPGIRSDPDGRPFGNGLGGILDEAGGSTIGGPSACPGPGSTCNTNVIGGNLGPGVVLATGTTGTTVAGNRIGTTLNGTGELGNAGAGIDAAGSRQLIGGPQAGAGNVVSGNTGPGIVVRGDHATVLRNLVGTDAAGGQAIPNGGAGILATDASGVTDGAAQITRNTVSGNTGAGVQLDQGGSTLSTNVVGLSADRRTRLPNGAQGVLVRRGPATISGAGVNEISGNLGAGIAITGGLPGLPPAGVRVNATLVEGNGGLPIDLGDDGPTANDPLDADAGPNGLANAPAITRASVAGGRLELHGTYDGVASSVVGVFLQRSASCPSPLRPDLSGQVGGSQLTTNADGHGAFLFTEDAGTLVPGSPLTAYVVAPTGNTSEVAPCVAAVGGADLSVTQAVTDGVPVVAGQTVDVSVRVANAGPETATAVVLTDALPQDARLVSQPRGCAAPTGGQFRCALDPLAPGEAVTLHLLFEPGAIATLTNSVRVASDEVDVTEADAASDFAAAVTPAPGTQPGTDPGGSSDEPPPTFSRFLRVDPAGGVVFVTLPNGQRIRLQDYALVPEQTEVDATRGRVTITSSLPGTDAVQTGDFYGGRFRLTQPDAEAGLVLLKLDTQLRCGRHAPAAKRRRHVWGDAHGRYRTGGGTASATVRGTQWKTADTCDSTTVVVRRGVVDVDAKGAARPRHTTVHAGEQVTVRKR